jgi:hypothetical protein
MRTAAALLLILSPLAVAQTLDEPMIDIYRCEGDNSRSYVSKPLRDQTCALVARRKLLDERWQFISRTADGRVVSYDKESIDKSENRVTVWVQTHNEDGGERRTLTRDSFDCDKRTFATSSVAGYAFDGTSTRSFSYLTPITSPVVPGSINELIWKHLCDRS